MTSSYQAIQNDSDITDLEEAKSRLDRSLQPIRPEVSPDSPDSDFEVPSLSLNQQSAKKKPKKNKRKPKKDSAAADPSSSRRDSQNSLSSLPEDPVEMKRSYQPKGIFVNNVKILTSERASPSPTPSPAQGEPRNDKLSKRKGRGRGKGWRNEDAGQDGDAEGGEYEDEFEDDKEDESQDLLDDLEAQMSQKEHSRATGLGEETSQEISSVEGDGEAPAPRGFLSRKLWRFSLRTWLNLLVLVLMVTSTILVLIFVPIKDLLLSLSAWVEQRGVIGPVIYCAFLIVWIIFCLPTSFFELVAGFTFGFWIALAVTYIGKNIGCILAFLLGKSLGRQYVKKFVKRFKILRTLDRVIAKNSKKMVFLIRLAYMPIALKNYGLSFFAVKKRLFIIATLITTIPESIIFSFFGSSADDILDLLDGKYTGGTLGLVVLGIGVCLVLVVLALTFYYTRQEWKKVTEEVEAERRRKRSQQGLGSVSIVVDEEIEMNSSLLAQEN